MERIPFHVRIFTTISLTLALFCLSELSLSSLVLELPEKIIIPVNEKLRTFSIKDHDYMDHAQENDKLTILGTSHRSGMGRLQIRTNNPQRSEVKAKSRRSMKNANKGIYQIIILAKDDLSPENKRLLHSIELKKETQQGTELLPRFHGMTVKWNNAKGKYTKPRDDLVFSASTPLSSHSRMMYFEDRADLYQSHLTFSNPMSPGPLCQIGKADSLSIAPCDFIKAVIVSYTPENREKESGITIFFQDTEITAYHNQSRREISTFLTNDQQIRQMLTRLLPQRTATMENAVTRRLPRLAKKTTEIITKALYNGPLEQVLPAHDEISEDGIPAAKLLSEINIMEKETIQGRKTRLQRKVPAKSLQMLNQANSHFSFLEPVFTTSPAGCHIHASMQSIFLGFLNGEDIPEEEKELYGEPTAILTESDTESISSAVKAYIKMAHENGIRNPEIIIPSTAHIAFHALQNEEPHVRFHVVPANVESSPQQPATAQPDLNTIRSLITPNTILIVASAFTVPYGVTDPIREISDLVMEHDRQFGLHVDATMGGFALYWLNELGHTNEPFGFDLPGVTSVSMSTHDYAMSFPGSSMLLFRHSLYSQYLAYANTDGPSGPFFCSSRENRPLINPHLNSWCSLLYHGKNTYRRQFDKIHEIARRMKKAINTHDMLEIIGNPSICFAFRIRNDYAAESADRLSSIQEYMQKQKIFFKKQQNPDSLRFCVTAEQTMDEEFSKKFETALSEAVISTRNQRQKLHLKPVSVDSILATFNCSLSKNAFMQAVEHSRKSSSSLSIEQAVEKFKIHMLQTFNKETGKISPPFGKH